MTETNKTRLPIKIDPTSNGEFAPQPLPQATANALKFAERRAAEAAARAGFARRDFLRGLCGAAATLSGLNIAFEAQGATGGRYAIDKDAPFDPAAAAQSLEGDEFIFDVHTHMVDPSAGWRENRGAYWEQLLARFPNGSCGERDPVDCFSADYFIREIFENSDTDFAVLSFVPETPDGNPLNMEEANRVKALIDALGDGRRRLLLHAMVTPNAAVLDEQLARMEWAAANYEIAAWKCYTQWGADGDGWRLDDPATGGAFIAKAREIGVRNICIHKGLPFPGIPVEFAGCADVGAAAAANPDMNFLIYHSGFYGFNGEGPFDPDNVAAVSVDSLIKSLMDHDIPPNANVYADLGSTWRFVMRNPDWAAHLLGKLIKYVGEDRVLWGTDSIWYGSPQDQIQALRAFQISDALIDAHGYAPLAAGVKAKIFGLNGAAVYGVDPRAARRRAQADGIGRRKAQAAAGEPAERGATYGPKTRREYAALLRAKGGRP